MISPRPLAGEGGGEGGQLAFPLTSILSPEGERRYFGGVLIF